MRKLAFYACLALTLLLAGCVKEKIVTQPCNFTLKINEVKGSKVKFTVTPDNPDATYAFGVLLYEEETAGWPDEKLIEWQLDWMKNSYKEYSAQTQPCGSFADMYCYKGERSIKDTRLNQGTEYLLLVFQINPVTMEAIGPLYRERFTTLPVTKADLTFTVRNMGDGFIIIPDDPERIWFWEYEEESKITDVYGSPYFFYYDIIDMYDEYDFLENLLCRGEARWQFSRDDRSVRPGVKYTMALSAVTDGEISSDVLYMDFIDESGGIDIPYADYGITITE